MSEAFNVKSAIMEQIAKTNDDNLRIVFVLLLGVLEEIGAKIDNVMRDESTIKRMVLNGHVENHHADHDWIKEHKITEVRNAALIDRAMPLIDWAEKTKSSQEKFADNNRSSFRKIAENIFTHMAIAIIAALGTITIFAHLGGKV